VGTPEASNAGGRSSAGAVQPALREQFNLALFNVETAPYQSLNIVQAVYPSWIVSHVLSGCVETATEGVASVARAGDVMIHPPNVPFSESSITSGVHQWMIVDLSMSAFVDLFRLNPVKIVLSLLEPDSYARSFDKLEQSWRGAARLRSLRCAAQAFDLLAMVIESWHHAGSPPRSPDLDSGLDRFAPIISYMHTHMSERISRDDLARLAFLHPGYFDRVFRQLYGRPPMQMLRDLRLRRAAELLETTEEPLEAIAAACGLGDAAHFGRLFRRSFNVAPGRHRESAKRTRQSYIHP